MSFRGGRPSFVAAACQRPLTLGPNPASLFGQMTAERQRVAIAAQPTTKWLRAPGPDVPWSAPAVVFGRTRKSEEPRRGLADFNLWQLGAVMWTDANPGDVPIAVTPWMTGQQARLAADRVPPRLAHVGPFRAERRERR